MIKINLSANRKKTSALALGGFDFTKIKIKAVLLVIVIIYLPDFFIVPMWEEEFANVQQELSAKQTKLNSLKRKVGQSQDMEKQIQNLKLQEEALEQKLVAVKQAISTKKNPAPLLLYIAKNVPNDLWIKELDIDNDVMLIKGEALDYNSIGNFVNSLRSSVFIKDANISKTQSVQRESDKRRIEEFEVKFSIARFEQ